ncbi:poly-beta-1,6-N-acetyl-D-glucosamine N-deacetylase [Kordia sp. SMS9]|uniref:polysaccharide deacetylase family protein n=1 Tax=Kordia sp. SMS9 TaxID=2282170 RepID=UPI000E103058|nr:polysaccharide deacetylase family protein [Kordia sp. SMS9]AXG70308.1 poly-beta-1,6-N-acetyl-D-glucosamine N-deacetylase [Kordia sp. SMS9]
MPKLPILMYHAVTTETSQSNGLTISVEHLEAQFRYLHENGYTSLHFSDLQQLTSPSDFPQKAVIITFDDVYVNQLELAYPLLKKYGLKACFFIPFQYVNGVDAWNTSQLKLMSVAQLKSMDEATIELGLHSFAHKKYDVLSATEIDEDFKKCKQFIVGNQLNVSNVLAYPYGKFPRKNPAQNTFFDLLVKHQVSYGLRIGNRVNTFPFKDNYQVQRLDIKGEDSLKKFKSKLRKGKSLFF